MATAAIARQSGSTLTPCYMKTGHGMDVQAAIMQSASHVFVPVLATVPGGYVMPVLEPLRTSDNVWSALTKLRSLWYSSSLQRSKQHRATYHQYVMSVTAPDWLKKCAQDWYLRTAGIEGTKTQAVHGDATLENAVMFSDSMARWIDPCPHTALPCEAELDGGKLWQSLYGYHELPAGCVATISQFMVNEGLQRQLTAYYFASHLVRLWRHQPAKRDWATQIAQEVLGA